MLNGAGIPTPTSSIGNFDEFIECSTHSQGNVGLQRANL